MAAAMILILLLTVMMRASAQYPNILNYEYSTFGQCLSDADCASLVTVNASLVDLGLTCNAATSRCEVIGDFAIPPDFSIRCQNFSISTISYPSIAPASNAQFIDGIVVVTVSFNGAINYEGLLRLYSVEPSFAASPPDITDTSYIQQQYVNYPTTTYIFRRLAPNAAGDGLNTTDGTVNEYYAVRYFDIAGCSSQPPLVKVRQLQNGTGMTPDYPGTLTLNSLGIAIFNSAQFTIRTTFADGSPSAGRLQSYAFNISSWGGLSTTNNDPFDVGTRRLFCQLFEGGGKLMQTKTCDVFDVYSNTTCMIQFPPFSPGTLVIPVQQLSYFVGYYYIECGFGYSIKRTVAAGNTTKVVRYLLQNSKGAYEGITFGQSLLNIRPPVGAQYDRPGFLPSSTPGYLQYTALLPGMINTRLVNDTSTGLTFSYVNYTTSPVVNVYASPSHQTVPLNHLCLNGSVTGATVVLDYSNFSFTSTFHPADVELFYLDVMTTYLLNTTGQVALAILKTATFTIQKPGVYCAALSANLLDGLFSRPYLYSCFQVSTPVAALTQISAEVLPPANFVSAYPYLNYAGFGSIIATQVYVDLPSTMYVPSTGYELKLVVLRMSSDPDDLAQLQLFDGLEEDVFTDPMTSFPITYYYSITDAGNGYDLYERIHEFQYQAEGPDSIYYNIASEVLSESVNVGIQIVEDIDYFVNVTQPFVQYQCTLSMVLNFISQPALYNIVDVNPATCPDQYGLMTVYVRGADPVAFDNPQFVAQDGHQQPFQNPAVYYQVWTNNATGDVLQSSLNSNRFAAPQNVGIKVQSYANDGQVATTVVFSTSDVPEGSTVITYLPELPTCTNNNTQYVFLEYLIGGVVTAGNVTYWQPAAVLAAELYTPNVASFDLPRDCPLLGNMTEYDVYNLCQPQPPAVAPSMCIPGCDKLPIVYVGTQTLGTQGGTFLALDDETWWEAVVWTPSDVFDTETGRFVYCRVALSIQVQVPKPPIVLFSRLRRVIGVGNIPCQGANCYVVTMTRIIDPTYVDAYPAALFTLTTSPATLTTRAGVFATPAIGPDDRYVDIDAIYQVTISWPGVFCEATYTYAPLARGPLIQVVDTTRSSCASATGQATLYVRYDDPDTGITASRGVCMYWPNRDVAPPATSSLQQYFYFLLPPNAPSSYVIPDGTVAFAGETEFDDVRAGAHTILIYECGVNGLGCSPSFNCESLLPVPTTLVLSPNNDDVDPNNDLAYQIFNFNVSNLMIAGGGIQIEATFTPAACYGDSNAITYVISDNLGEDGRGFPPYVGTLYEPVTGNVLYNSPSCFQGGINYTSTVPLVVGTRVTLFSFNVVIPTGPAFGLRFDGNYTLVIMSCLSKCLQTSNTFIQMPQPFDIGITVVNATCATGTGGSPGLVREDISGGNPFPEGYFPPFSYAGTPNGQASTIVRQQIYKLEYITPTSGPGYVQQNLGIVRQPGFYSLRVTDSQNCTAVRNYTVYSPAPLTISYANASQACASSTSSTVTLVVSGGMCPCRPLEALSTNVTSDTNLTLEFFNSLGRPLSIRVIDSYGCVSAPILTTPPKPAPVAVAILTTLACASRADGTATVVTNATNPICKWAVDRGSVNLATTACTLTGLLGGTQVSVQVSDSIGCSGTATSEIISTPPILIHQLVRTTLGEFGGPCIENITVLVTGGIAAPYILSLNPTPTSNASIVTVSTNTSLFTVVNACRDVVYVIIAIQASINCPASINSVDPEYGFGNDPLGVIPVGMDDFVTVSIYLHHSNRTRADQTTSPLVTVASILVPIFVVLICAAAAFLSSL